MYDSSLKKLKRLLVAVIGITMLVIGIAMIVLPGPAIVVIPLALGILATEFAWAARLLQKVRERIEEYRKSKTYTNKEKPL
jgi:uncharacterized protein (TIGR02611 family)